MISLNQIIENSKQRLDSCFYKEVKDDQTNSWFLIEYTGPKKSLKSMLADGWRVFPKRFLKDITPENPIFNFSDYQFLSDKKEIVRKSENENLKNKLLNIEYYLTINNDQKLRIFLSHIKSIFSLFNLNFLNFISFNELLTKYNEVVNKSSLNINEKTDYLVAMSEYLKNIQSELNSFGILNSDKFFNENFKYFLILVD